MREKGFTLIELLVVVAIIGILATVVLASLGSARTRARRAAVDAAMNQIRPQAEISYMDSSNSYDNVCTAIASIIANIDASNGTAATPLCADSATEFAVNAVYGSSFTVAGITGSVIAVCVDETGSFVYKTTAVTTAATSC